MAIAGYGRNEHGNPSVHRSLVARACDNTTRSLASAKDRTVNRLQGRVFIG